MFGRFQQLPVTQLLGRQVGFTHGNLGGGFKDFLCSSLLGEDFISNLTTIFQMG